MTTRTISWALAGTLSLASQFASAALITYATQLSGPAEAPANASPGTGSTIVLIDTTAHTMNVNVTFSGLTAPTTMAHIHCCTAVPGAGTIAVATETPTFTSFPLGVTSGSYVRLYDLALTGTYNAPFLAANGATAASAELALIAGLNAGRAYLNIHTTAFPAGEIRGFLQRVPEPGSLWLAGLAMCGLLGMRTQRAQRR